MSHELAVFRFEITFAIVHQLLTQIRNGPPRLHSDPRSLVAGAGSVWIDNEDDGTVKRIEDKTGDVAESQLPGVISRMITHSVFRLAARRTDLTALIRLLEFAPVSEKPVGLNRSPWRWSYGH
jgi:hypothetical protein